MVHQLMEYKSKRTRDWVKGSTVLEEVLRGAEMASAYLYLELHKETDTTAC